MEIESDGEALCLNMAISSSSEDEATKDGEGADFQTVKADGEQLNNLLAVLEDVRVLFSEMEEQTPNTVKVIIITQALRVIEIFPTLNPLMLSILLPLNTQITLKPKRVWEENNLMRK